MVILLKKLINCLICLISIVAFLFLHGCSTESTKNDEITSFIKEEEKPKIVVTLHSYWSTPYLYPSDEPEQNYYMMNVHIENWSDFQSFELLMTFDPNVLAHCNAPGTVMRPCITCREMVISEQAPGLLRIIGREVDDAATKAFGSLSFLVIGDGEPNIDISFVSAMDLYGQDIDCILEVNYSVA